MLSYEKIQLDPCNQSVDHVRADDYVFVFNGHDIWVSANMAILQGSDPLMSNLASYYYCFAMQGKRRCLLIDGYVDEAAMLGLKRVQLKTLYGVLPDELFLAAGLAQHLHHWRTKTNFCGVCGGHTVDSVAERARICERCNQIFYPRVAPSIIVLVKKGKQLLLARSPHFKEGMYSTLAGFVEPGETLEHAVKREVYEEVHIQVDNLRYVCSQPWPFPNSLMIGFYADYVAGTLAIDHNEISDAAWFDRDNLPQLPGDVSIARYLIDHV